MRTKTADVIFLVLAIWTIAALFDFMFSPVGYGINENWMFNMSGFFTGVVLILGQIIRWVLFLSDRKKGIAKKSTAIRMIASILTVPAIALMTLVIMYLIDPGPK